MKTQINPTALKAENDQLKSLISKLTAENQKLLAMTKWYAEQFKHAQQMRFGKSSEAKVIPEQLGLFNEAEATEKTAAPEPNLEEIITYRRKKSKGKRDQTYSELPTTQKIYELPEDQRACPECGRDLHACGHEVLRREIEVIPATIRAVEHIQTVYTCRACEKNTSDKLKVPMIKTTVPAPVIAGSGIASPSLAAFIISNKYVLALPLNRQENEFARQGINISRQTMANWCMYTADHWLKRIYELLYADFLKYDIGQADETIIQVINEPDRKSSTNSYMWLYQTGKYAEKQIVLFDYAQTRAGNNPSYFLTGFKGYLNVDGYSGYNALEKNGITLCGCWTHMRRKFVDVLKTIFKHLQKDSPASIGLCYCDKLFELERKYDEEGLSPEERKKRRDIESKPVAMDFFAWAKRLLPSLPDKSKIKEAIVYAVNQEQRLLNFLLDGRIEISNNRAERSIRPFTIGRNNWMFAFSPKGAHASAVIYSIVETAKANGLVPFKYLEFLFETLPNIPVEQFGSCLPWVPQVIQRCSLPS